MIMIKKALFEDAGTAAKLAVQLWDECSVEDMTAEFEAMLSGEEATVFILYLDDMPVGFSQCQLRHDYVEGTQSSPVGYHLEGVFIDEQHRQNGYARRLVEACEQWAKEQGCTEFASDCELINTQSLAFHLSCGFQEVNRIVCFTKQI